MRRSKLDVTGNGVGGSKVQAAEVVLDRGNFLPMENYVVVPMLLRELWGPPAEGGTKRMKSFALAGPSREE